MDIRVNDRLHGFTVTRIRENSEIRGRMVEMTFDKTGTELVWIDNGEENKLFSITFRTLPENSTGVFHILEHSTLCGSKKFPVREPFVELLKSSMNTFLNAMTFQDKTMYPVSSRNDKDYMNLTEVYLDAVFAPRLLTDPNIFYQEGWHIEADENKEFSYKGVVFNEMKGAMSGADRVIAEKVNSMLYPDNSYGFNSGGDPACIPDLSYEMFCDTYRRFYHPSNAKVFLDGNVPLEKVLTLLEEYLSPFDKAPVPQPVMQCPKGGEDTIEFEVAANESLQNRSRLSLARLVGSWQDDKARILGLSLITDVLCGSNESPLKRAVLESGLAQDINMYIDDSNAQIQLETDIVNIKDGCEEQVKALVFDTLADLIGKGLDRDALTASLNRTAFRMREGQEPQGLIRCISALSGCWLFGGDPMEALVYDEAIHSLRTMIENGSLNRLAEEVLLTRENLVTVYAHPSFDAGEKLRQAEKARLDAVKAAMTEQEVNELNERNEKLTSWQATPDSEEALATLPTLTLKDVSSEPRHVETVCGEDEGVLTLFHPVNCHGIKYLNLYFNISDTKYEDLPALHFAGSLFGVLPTEKYDAQRLEQEIKNTFGRLTFLVSPRLTDIDKATGALQLQLHASVLDDNLDKAQELICEILFNTRFDCHDRIKEMILQEEEASKQAGAQAGHMIAITAAASHFSPIAAANEALSGYTGMQYLHALAADFEGGIGRFEQIYRSLASNAFCRARLTVSVSGTENTALSLLLSKLPEGEKAPEEIHYVSALPMKLGLRTPAQISFAVKSCTLRSCGFTYDGSMGVASNILTLAYLWNRVRVQGGAYGTGFRAAPGGAVFTYSYRDPTPDKSLQVYSEMGDFMRAFASSAPVIDNFIISTIAETEPLIGPREQGQTADNNYFSHITLERERAALKQMLAATPDKLCEFATVLDQYNEKGAVCVVGHDAALKACEGLEIFDL